MSCPSRPLVYHQTVRFRRSRLRAAVLLLALLALLLVAGFYNHARRQARRALRDLPRKLGVEVSQQAQGFTFSKSEGGHTLFTIHASKLVQFKTGASAELHDVSIVVFGREGNRFDQIYGSDFSYDQKTGEVRAQGPVEIDLESYGPGEQRPADRPDQRPPQELKNPVHIKTSGVLFSQKTGVAQTAERIDFRTSQGDGSAVGAIYDSHGGELHLLHDVSLATAGATITARSAVFDQQPAPEALLTDAVISSPQRTTHAALLRAGFRPDGSLDHLSVQGGLHSESSGPSRSSVSAQQAEVEAGDANRISTVRLLRDVVILSGSAHANADSALVHFKGKNIATSADLAGGAAIAQPDGSRLESRAIHFTLRPDRSLARATTSAAATLTLPPGPQSAGNTVITADRMSADFNERSAIESLHAAPQAKIVAPGPDGIPRVTTSAALDATFSQGNGKPALAALIESGDVRISEASRIAHADRAEYNPATQVRRTYWLSQALRPRHLRHRNKDRLQSRREHRHCPRRRPRQLRRIPIRAGRAAFRPWASARHRPDRDPTQNGPDHLSATFTGSPARLWQAADVLQAPRIQLDRKQRTLLATGASGQNVTTTFVQPDKTGKLVPVKVSAPILKYADQDRTAHFEGASR